MVKINKIIWKETFVEKIESKHHVTMFEVEEILHGKRKFIVSKKAMSKVKTCTWRWGKPALDGFFRCSSF